MKLTEVYTVTIGENTADYMVTKITRKGDVCLEATLQIRVWRKGKSRLPTFFILKLKKTT